MSDTPLWDQWAGETSGLRGNGLRICHNCKAQGRRRGRQVKLVLCRHCGGTVCPHFATKISAPPPEGLTTGTCSGCATMPKTNPDADLQSLLRGVKSDPNDFTGWRDLLTQAWRSGMTIMASVGEAPDGTVGGSLAVGDTVEGDFPIRSGRQVGLSVTKPGEVTSSMIYAKRMKNLRLAPQRQGEPPGPGRVDRRPNPDESERILERAAKLGDVRAQRKLDQMRARRGVKKTLTWGVVPEYDEFLEHTSAMGVEWPVEFDLNPDEGRAVRSAIGPSTFRRYERGSLSRSYLELDSEAAFILVQALVQDSAAMRATADRISQRLYTATDQRMMADAVDARERSRNLATRLMEVMGYEWI